MAKKVLYEIDVKSNYKDLAAMKKELDALTNVQKAWSKGQMRNSVNAQRMDERIRKLKTSISETKKETANYAKATEGLGNSYNNLTAQNAILSKQLRAIEDPMGANKELFDETALAIKNNTDKLKEMDAAMGRQQRNVGNYSEALDNLGLSFSQTKEQVKTFGNSLKVLAKNPFFIVITGLLAVLSPLIGYFTRTQKGIDNIDNSMAYLSASVDVIIGRFSSLGEGLYEIFSGNFSKGAGILRDAFKGVGSAIKDAAQEGIKMSKLTKEYERQSIAINEQIAILEQQQILNEKIADDNTRSFKERTIASNKSKKELEDIGALRIKLAQNELDIINRKVELDKKAGLLTIDLEKQQSEARQELIRAEQDYTNTVFDNEKQRRELKQDTLEIDLDYAIDAFDSQKTLNEKLIQNTELTEAERIAILERTRELSDASFQEQERIIQEFTNKKVDLNKLIAMEDEKQQLAEIRRLGFSEKIETRIMEIIKEKRMVKQDLIDTEKELMKSITDRQNSEEKSEFDLLTFRKEVEIAKLKENEKTLIDKSNTIAKEKELIALLTSFEIEQIEKSNDSKEDKSNQIILLKEQENEELRKLDLKYLSEKEKQDAEDDKKRKERNQEIKEFSIAAAQETSDSLFAIKQENLARQTKIELDQLQQKSDMENDILKSKLESGLITQEEYENNRIALAQKVEEEKEKIQREAFEKKKRLDTAQALINGALAVTLAFAQSGWPAGIATAALTAIATGAEVATIQAQQYAQGGLLEGNSHAQGGIPMLVDGKRPIEAEGGEAIINKRSVQMFGKELDYINRAGGGVPLFENGGYIRKFANGGLIQQNGVNMQDLEEQNRIFANTLKNIKVINVASDTINTYDNTIRIENEFTF